MIRFPYALLIALALFLDVGATADAADPPMQFEGARAEIYKTVGNFRPPIISRVINDQRRSSSSEAAGTAVRPSNSSHMHATSRHAAWWR
jgi:hypothetical protein